MNDSVGESLDDPDTLPSRCDPLACAYFLDFDGTLVEIADRPGSVDVDQPLLSLIAALYAAASGAVAIISGRPISEIDRLFEPVCLPAAGQHGAERRDAEGKLHRHAPHGGGLDALRGRGRAWQDRFPQLLIEDKGLSIAFHFRQAPELSLEVERELQAWLADHSHAFDLQRGKMVLEVRPIGIDKGRAIGNFLAEHPFQGRNPVFIGDDTTDEFGFAVVNTFGGRSIKVGAGPTIAQSRLDDVRAVRAWLGEALGRRDD